MTARQPDAPIALLLTPPGAGAIGLIRVLGASSEPLVSEIFRPARGELLTATKPGSLRYGTIVDGDEVLDDVLVVRHEVNRTPCVDISAHGGIRVIERLLTLLERRGAKLHVAAPPADLVWPVSSLIEREALTLLPTAKTQRAARFLLWQSVHLAAAVAAAADQWQSDPSAGRRTVQGLLAGHETARRLLSGVSVAIVGPPNSGKSSLFNRLVGRSAAIVSDRPGTTRDWVTDTVELGGFAVTYIDTAGVREVDDALEAQAIRAGRAAARDADLFLLVLDAADRDTASNAAKAHLHDPARTLVVFNKSDLPEAAAPPIAPGVPSLALSAKTGAGVAALADRLLTYFGEEGCVDRTPTLFTERQVDLALRWASAPPDGDAARAACRDIIGSPAGQPASDAGARL